MPCFLTLYLNLASCTIGDAQLALGREVCCYARKIPSPIATQLQSRAAPLSPSGVNATLVFIARHLVHDILRHAQTVYGAKVNEWPKYSDKRPHRRGGFFSAINLII